MNYSSDQVVNGIIRYADAEVMSKLPTSGKWVMGTALVLASNKIPLVIETLKENPIVNMLGIVDDNDNIDVDSLMMAMKKAADQYGSVTLEVPLVGKLMFSGEDIDHLKAYIG